MAKATGRNHMNVIGSLRARILDSIKPTDEEIKLATYRANDIIARLKAVAPKDVEIITAGSVARGTQVRGSYDIDIFLLFPKSRDERKMEAMGLKIAQKIVNKKKGESFIIKYAEHPYVKVLFDGGEISADIVPAFRIRTAAEMGSAVDRTPLHNEFVNKHLNERQKDDVRILKAFLKNHQIYGAEAQVHGFSGYLCELMISNYGSFNGVIGRFADLKLPLIIDVGNKAEIDPKSAEGTALIKQFKTDFIFIDPTDVNRNVAASLSKSSAARFVILAKALMKKADMKTFSGAKYSTIISRDAVIGLHKSMGLDVYLLALESDDIADDIIWEQLVKLKGRICTMLAKNGFPPVLALQNASKSSCIIAFFMNRTNLGSVPLGGPSAFMGGSASAFFKAHKASFGFFLYDDKLISIEKPRHVSAESLLRGLKRDPNFIMPSHIKTAGSFFYSNNDIPEDYAKMLYEAFESARIKHF